MMHTNTRLNATFNQKSKLQNRKSRPAFTITELLVAMALTMFMMAILSEAFVVGLQSFRNLKAISDMDQQLRTAVTILRKDLTASHFEGNLSLSKLGVLGPKSDSVQINQGELPYTVARYDPQTVLPGVGPVQLFDVDGDGLITFRDLNYQERRPPPLPPPVPIDQNHSPNSGAYPNRYRNQVNDVNGNGYIDPMDLHHPIGNPPLTRGLLNNVDNDLNGAADDLIYGFSPELGFFRIGEGFYGLPYYPNGPLTMRPCITEGRDSSFSTSQRDTNDFLDFTVRLSGNRPEDYARGRVPQVNSIPPDPTPGGDPTGIDDWTNHAPDNVGSPYSRFDDFNNGVYTSQWYHVMYFLRPQMQDTLDPATNLPQPITTQSPTFVAQGGVPAIQQVPRYNLYRRQLSLIPEQFTNTPYNSQTSAAALAYRLTPYPVPPLTPVPPVETNRQFYYRDYDVSVFEAQTGPNTFAGFFYNSPADVQIPERRLNPFLLTPVAPGLTRQPSYLTFPIYGLATGAGPPPPPPGIVAAADHPIDRAGADLLMTDVLSFDIKIWDPVAVEVWSGTPNSSTLLGLRGEWVDLGHLTSTGVSAPGAPNNPLALNEAWNIQSPFFGPGLNLARNLVPMSPGAPFRIYDTWTSRNSTVIAGPSTFTFNYASGLPQTRVPYPMPIRAIKITIRIWDQETKQTRQVTIIQDM